MDSPLCEGHCLVGVVGALIVSISFCLLACLVGLNCRHCAPLCLLRDMRISFLETSTSQHFEISGILEALASQAPYRARTNSSERAASDQTQVFSNSFQILCKPSGSILKIHPILLQPIRWR